MAHATAPDQSRARRSDGLPEPAGPFESAVVDLDLWKAPSPGADDGFDADRFGEWLEALVEHDPEAAARIVSRCDRSVVVTGLSRYVRVFDPGVQPLCP